MKICGFNKTTLLDYPGRVACTIFRLGVRLHDKSSILAEWAAEVAAA